MGALPGVGGLLGGLAVNGLTLKGYGFVEPGTSTGNVTMSYGTIGAGSAPVAGDLVVWFAMGRDTSASPVVALTGGWVQANGASISTYYTTIAAKVIAAGDISSPQTLISAPTNGVFAFWVAFTQSAPITALAISTPTGSYGGSGANSPLNVNSSGIGSDEVAVSLAFGYDVTGLTSNALRMSVSGGSSPIIQVERYNIVPGGTQGDVEWFAHNTPGGENLTFTKGVDGTANLIAGGYVRVTF